MSTQLDTGRRILAAQPFSTFIGAKLVHLDGGQAELRIPLRLDLYHQGGYTHGGVAEHPETPEGCTSGK